MRMPVKGTWVLAERPSSYLEGRSSNRYRLPTGAGTGPGGGGRWLCQQADGLVTRDGLLIRAEALCHCLASCSAARQSCSEASDAMRSRSLSSERACRSLKAHFI